MKERYIFFIGLIDTLDLYTEEFVEIFTGQGRECLVLDAGNMEDAWVQLKAFLLEPVAGVISFNNIGLHLEIEDGINIWDRYQIPFYNILMDHPFHYKKALDTAPQQMILLCMDQNHIEYVKRFYPNIQKISFFPHAGIASGFYDQCENATLRIEERKIDVLYAGGLSRYAAEGLIPDLGRITEFDAFALVKSALEKLIQKPDLTTEYVIEDCFKDINLKLNDKQLGELITELRFIDSFAVSFYREQMVRVLAENGIIVTVFGRGWERCEWQHPNMVYGGEIRPASILALMKQSKIVLNTMTWFKRGAHDRIFNGMLAGAVVVSDCSEYLNEHFTNGHELQMFTLQEIDRLPEIVHRLLIHTDEAQDIADCGYRSAIKSHRWINRLRKVHLID